MHREVSSVNFHLLKNVKYFSKEGTHYLIFEEKGNLRLKDQNEENVWSAIKDSEFPEGGYVDNTCFLHSNGNLVILDSNKNALWTSSQDLLSVCNGDCLNDDHCSSGLECYIQNSDRRRLEEVSQSKCHNNNAIISLFQFWSNIYPMK